MESWDSGFLSQHTHSADRLQNRPANRRVHAHWAVQSEADTHLARAGLSNDGLSTNLNNLAELLVFCLDLWKSPLRTSSHCILADFSVNSQGSSMAKQLGAETYLECSAFTSEKSIHSVFRTAAQACISKVQPADKPSPVRRLSKRLLHLPSKTELLSSTFSKDKSKSCSIM